MIRLSYVPIRLQIPKIQPKKTLKKILNSHFLSTISKPDYNFASEGCNAKPVDPVKA